eukprot:gene6156-9199_t
MILMAAAAIVGAGNSFLQLPNPSLPSSQSTQPAHLNASGQR